MLASTPPRWRSEYVSKVSYAAPVDLSEEFDVQIASRDGPIEPGLGVGAELAIDEPASLGDNERGRQERTRVTLKQNLGAFVIRIASSAGARMTLVSTRRLSGRNPRPASPRPQRRAALSSNVQGSRSQACAVVRTDR